MVGNVENLASTGLPGLVAHGLSSPNEVAGLATEIVGVETDLWVSGERSSLAWKLLAESNRQSDELHSLVSLVQAASDRKLEVYVDVKCPLDALAEGRRAVNELADSVMDAAGVTVISRNHYVVAQTPGKLRRGAILSDAIVGIEEYLQSLGSNVLVTSRLSVDLDLVDRLRMRAIDTVLFTVESRIRLLEANEVRPFRVMVPVDSSGSVRLVEQLT